MILIASWLSPEKRRNDLIEALACQGGENAASLALAGWSLAEGAPVSEDIRLEVKERLLGGLNTAQKATELGILVGALLAADPAALLIGCGMYSLVIMSVSEHLPWV